MSLELVGCKVKLNPITLEVFTAMCRVRDVAVSAAIRELVEREVEKFVATLSEAERLLASKGFGGELGRLVEQQRGGGIKFATRDGDGDEHLIDLEKLGATK